MRNRHFVVPFGSVALLVIVFLFSTLIPNSVEGQEVNLDVEKQALERKVESCLKQTINRRFAVLDNYGDQESLNNFQSSFMDRIQKSYSKYHLNVVKQWIDADCNVFLQYPKHSRNLSVSFNKILENKKRFGKMWAKGPPVSSDPAIAKEEGKESENKEMNRVVAKVKAIHGKVWVKRGGSEEKSLLKKGDPLRRNDFVTTSGMGRVVFDFNEGEAELTLAPRSALNVKSYTKRLERDKEKKKQFSLFNLIKGKLKWVTDNTIGWVMEKIRERLGKVVYTHNSACGVRGTEFILEHDAERVEDRYLVREGTIEVATNHGTTLVHAGESLVVTQDGPGPVQRSSEATWAEISRDFEIPGSAQDVEPPVSPRSEEGSKPHTFSEDFDDGRADDFGAESGAWYTKFLNGDDGVYTATGGGGKSSLAGDASWRNYVIEAEFGNAQDGGILARAQDKDNAMLFVVSPKNDVAYWLTKRNGRVFAHAKSRLGYSPGERLNVRAVASGDSFKGFVNGKLMAVAQDPTFPTGKVGLFLYAWPDQYWDDVRVRLEDR